MPRLVFNPTFLHRLALWAYQRHWEQNTTNSTAYADLVLDFMLTAKTYPPFPVSKYPGSTFNRQENWTLKDEHPTRDLQGTQLHDFLSGSTRTIHQGEITIHIYIFLDSHQEQVSSMSTCSYKDFVRGVRHSVAISSAQKLHQYCQTYLMNQHNLKLPVPSL